MCLSGGKTEQDKDLKEHDPLTPEENLDQPLEGKQFRKYMEKFTCLSYSVPYRATRKTLDMVERFDLGLAPLLKDKKIIVIYQKSISEDRGFLYLCIDKCYSNLFKEF